MFEFDRLGASFVCASDYPSTAVIENLKTNINLNFGEVDLIAVEEHIWGSDTHNLISINNGRKYDILVASECLWKHEQVEDNALIHRLLINKVNSFY